jgi:hypothetical protein
VLQGDGALLLGGFRTLAGAGQLLADPGLACLGLGVLGGQLLGQGGLALGGLLPGGRQRGLVLATEPRQLLVVGLAGGDQSGPEVPRLPPGAAGRSQRIRLTAAAQPLPQRRTCGKPQRRTCGKPHAAKPKAQASVSV